MKSRRALTLIETMMALSIFVLTAAGISGAVLSSAKLRGLNQSNSVASQFAKQVLEKHKDYWSIVDNYQQASNALLVLPDYVRTGGKLVSDLPDGLTVSLSYGCLGAAGQNLSSTTAPLFCQQVNPPLRWVRVILKDSQNTVRADLRAEIGRPIARDKVQQ